MKERMKKKENMKKGIEGIKRHKRRKGREWLRRKG